MKGVQFFCNTNANGFWLDENAKETTKNQSDFSCFNKKFKKMAVVFCKQRCDFVPKTTIEKLKKTFQKPEHGKKYVFLAK